MGSESRSQAAGSGPAERWAWAVYPLLIFAIVAWGGSFVASRIVLAAEWPDTTALSPTLLAAARYLLASLLLLPILYRQHRRVQPLRVDDAPAFLLVGLFGISLYFWLQFTGLQLTNAGLSAVLVVGTIPLATVLLAALVLKEPLTGPRLAALALGAAGVLVVVSQKEIEIALESGFIYGAACLIANAFCFAIYSTLVRGLRARYAPLTVTAGMTVAGTLPVAGWSLLNDNWGLLSTLSGRQWLAIGYLAVVCSVVAYIFFNFALSRVEAGKVAAWTYLEPPIAIALGSLLLGEVVMVQTVVGGLIILFSLSLLQRA